MPVQVSCLLLAFATDSQKGSSVSLLLSLCCSQYLPGSRKGGSDGAHQILKLKTLLKLKTARRVRGVHFKTCAIQLLRAISSLAFPPLAL